MEIDENTTKPIILRYTLKGHKDSIIPEGLTETLTIRITNNHAYYHFNNSKITKAFVLKNNKETPFMATYLERLQVARVYYPNWDKITIYKEILKSMVNNYGARQK